MITDQGKGSFVRPDTPLIRLGNDRYSPRHRDTGLSPFKLECAKQGKTGRFEVLSIDRVQPPADVAGRLGVSDKTKSVVRRENVFYADQDPVSELLSAGGLECLAASVSYAVSYIYMDRFLARRGIGAVVLSACQLLIAAVQLAIALAVAGAPAPHVTAGSVTALVVLGIVGTGFAYVLNYQITTSEGATVASTVTYLLPVVAIMLGVLVLSETITVTTIAGIALVLAGVARTRRQTKADSREIRVE